MPTKPDFSHMSLAAQLVAYNSLMGTPAVPEPRRSKFKNQRAGANALEAAWRSKYPPTSRSRQRGMKIRLLVDRNPRRDKTGGHRFFAALQGSETVADYYAKFSGPTEIRDARLWLYFNRRDGYVELVD